MLKFILRILGGSLLLLVSNTGWNYSNAATPATSGATRVYAVVPDGLLQTFKIDSEPIDPILGGLANATSFTIDSRGNYYVCNFVSGAVTVYHKDGNEVEPTIYVAYPIAVAVDGSGNIYVQSQYDGLFAFNASGRLISKFQPPGYLLTVNSAGDMFLGDTGMGGTFIREVSPAGKPLKVYRLKYITGSFTALTIGKNGYFYVGTGSVNAGQVRVYNSAGVYVGPVLNLSSPVTGLGVGSSRIYVSTGGGISTFTLFGTETAPSIPGTFEHIALDPQGVIHGLVPLVGVLGTNTNEVTSYSVSGKQVAPTISPGLYYPIGVTVDSAGKLYVLNGTDVLTFTSSGVQDRPTISTGFGSAKGLAVGPNGDIYVAGDSEIRSYTSTGTPTHPTLPLTYNPVAITVDHNGKIYVVGSDSIVRSYTSNGVPTKPTISYLMNPTSVAVNARGDIYVADAGFGSVTTYDKSGNPIAPAITGLNDPVDVTVDSAGVIYVLTGGGRIRSYSASGKLMSAINDVTFGADICSFCNVPVGIAVH